jgi:hypothetical protein
MEITCTFKGEPDSAPGGSKDSLLRIHIWEPFASSPLSFWFVGRVKGCGELSGGE